MKATFGIWVFCVFSTVRSFAGQSAQVKLVDIIPQAYSAETYQDSEPFLSLDPDDPQVMVISAFTPDPAGDQSTTAPIFVSTDGGDTWTLRSIVPSRGQTADISHAMLSGHRLFAGILAVPSDSLPLEELTSADVLLPSPMTIQGSRNRVDQPFVVAASVDSEQRVYIGMNDFGQAGGRTATLDITSDGGSSYKTVPLESRSTLGAGQDGPSVRPAAAKDGKVYASFLGWRSFDGTIANADVVVLRDDNGGKNPKPFTSLMGADGLAGVVVERSVKIPWVNGAALGPERIGSTLALAVDPGQSSRVYVAWGQRIGNGDVYSIVVRSSSDGGNTWTPRRVIKNATCIALSISNSGIVGFLYQQYVNEGDHGRWVTKLEQTKDDFNNVQPTILADVSADLAQPNLPYNGDYNCLLSVGSEFRGVFSANNQPIPANFVKGVKYQRKADFGNHILLDMDGKPVLFSIDPFYFSVPIIQ